MNLKNYTSTVPASVTIGRIQSKLLEARVSQISMAYTPQGVVEAITFAVQVWPDKPPVHVKIPANVEAALDAFWLEYVGTDRLSADGQRLAWQHGNKKKCRKDFLEQAERTAWKIVQDWVEVQLTMVALRQAEFIQVFLPYVWNGRQTFFDRLQSNNFLALTDGAPEGEPRRVN